MMNLKTKWLNKWTKKQNISDDTLLYAIENMKNNLSSVNLGGSLFKVRVSFGDRGKSSGFRTIIVYRKDDRAVIVYGFLKKEQENLTRDELKSFKTLAKDILALSEQELELAIKKRVFVQIKE